MQKLFVVYILTHISILDEIELLSKVLPTDVGETDSSKQIKYDATVYDYAVHTSNKYCVVI